MFFNYFYLLLESVAFLSQWVYGESWVGRCSLVFLALLETGNHFWNIPEGDEDVGGLLLSCWFDARGLMSVPRRRCLDIGVGVVAVATPWNLPWEMRKVYSRIVSSRRNSHWHVASRCVTSPDEWTRAKTRTYIVERIKRTQSHY